MEARADVMLVGERPGDAEDLAGHPFVGPAGKLLDKALEEAGLDDELRREEMRRFVADLQKASSALAATAGENHR